MEGLRATVPTLRRHFRYRIQFSVEYNVISYLEEEVDHLREKKGTGQACDLAEEGMSFYTELCLPIDMVLNLRFTIPDLGFYQERAIVVRSKSLTSKWLTGVQFLSFTGRRREVLKEFISQEVKKKVRLVEYL